MEDANKLSAFLAVLTWHWEKLSENMDLGQTDELDDNIEKLKKNIVGSGKPRDLDNAAVDFFSAVRNIETLRSLVETEEKTLGSGSLPLPENDIKIKIINYCVIIDDKIEIKRKNWGQS